MSGREVATDVAKLAMLMNGGQEHEAVSHPQHYNMGGIECIDGIKAALGENYIGFLIGNVIKYCWRYKYKNGLEDIKKARYYLEKAIGELENDDGK